MSFQYPCRAKHKLQYIFSGFTIAIFNKSSSVQKELKQQQQHSSTNVTTCLSYDLSSAYSLQHLLAPFLSIRILSHATQRREERRAQRGKKACGEERRGTGIKEKGMTQSAVMCLMWPSACSFKYLWVHGTLGTCASDVCVCVCVFMVTPYVTS